MYSLQLNYKLIYSCKVKILIVIYYKKGDYSFDTLQILKSCCVIVIKCGSLNSFYAKPNQNIS